MSGFEVPEPILSGPYDEPAQHWRIVEGELPHLDAKHVTEIARRVGPQLFERQRVLLWHV